MFPKGPNLDTASSAIRVGASHDPQLNLDSWHDVLACAAAVLIVLVLLKAYTLVRLTAWLWARGADYRARVDALPPDQRLDLTVHARLTRDLGGPSLPFGGISYALWRGGVYNPEDAFLTRWAMLIAWKVWAMYSLVLLTALTLFLIGIADPDPKASFWSALDIFGYALALGVLLMAVCSAVSSSTVLIVLRSSAPIHIGIPKALHNESVLPLAQIGSFVGTIVCAWGAATSGVFFLSANASSKMPLGSPGSGLGDQAAHFLNCSYYVFLAVLGDEDANPGSWFAKLVMFLAMLAGLLFLLGALGLLAETVLDVPAVRPTTNDSLPTPADLLSPKSAGEIEASSASQSPGTANVRAAVGWSAAGALAALVIRELWGKRARARQALREQD